MLFAAGVAGCDVTQPVVVIDSNGQVLRGTATASLSGGSFDVSDGKLSCGGSYNSMSMEPTITMQARCSDGRKGIVIAIRDSSGLAGHGTVRLNDGTTGQFIFGPSAANFECNSDVAHRVIRALACAIRAPRRSNPHANTVPPFPSRQAALARRVLFTALLGSPFHIGQIASAWRAIRIAEQQESLPLDAPGRFHAALPSSPHRRAVGRSGGVSPRGRVSDYIVLVFPAPGSARTDAGRHRWHGGDERARDHDEFASNTSSL